MKRKNLSYAKQMAFKKLIEGNKDKIPNRKSKDYWKNAQREMTKKMETNGPAKVRKGRSMSCVCDFLVEEIPQQKYMLKNSIKLKASKKQSVDEQTLFEGISIIGGSKTPFGEEGNKKIVDLEDVEMVLDDS